MTNNFTLSSEWAEQSAVQIAWPHENTDWESSIEKVEAAFTEIAYHISRKQKLIIISPDISRPKRRCQSLDQGQIIYAEAKTNDTWCRDFGGITLTTSASAKTTLKPEEIQIRRPLICDFTFNGWGEKFPFELDNEVTKTLYSASIFSGGTVYKNCRDFVLEGGSIESDGAGTIMTTSKCLLSPKRNGNLSMEEIEIKLKEYLGAKQVLWLHSGELTGDDTDGHIDTLARFCPGNIICYVKCENPGDEHFLPLKEMESQLATFKNMNGHSYRLIPMPMPDAMFHDGLRLPATYVNFLIINGAVLCPSYNSSKDDEALKILSTIFPEREIVPIDCSEIIKQGGALHCLTMQFPKGAI